MLPIQVVSVTKTTEFASEFSREEQRIMSLDSRIRRIKVEVKPGMFSSEKTVSFMVGAQRYVMIVDERDVDEATSSIQVVVLGTKDGSAMVNLPRETFTSGTRIEVPEDLLVG